MKRKLTYIFIFSLIFISNSLISQDVINEIDTLKKTNKKLSINKLRFGLDISKPIISSMEKDDLNLEFVGDLQVSDNLYFAAEIGSTNKLIEDENINFNSTGEYLKIGIDYNMFNNWVGMDNSIYIGLRYATSNFSNSIQTYTVRNSDSYFSNEVENNYENITHSGLNGNWLEFLIGVKVETFNNLYLGISVRLNKLISDLKPNNFDNLFIPGFNKVTDDNTWGSGFNYTLTYSIPLKRNKKTL
jgi:hypothetical protein